MDTPEDEKTKLLSCLGAFRQFWGGLPPVSAAADDFGPLLILVFLVFFYIYFGVGVGVFPGRER